MIITVIASVSSALVALVMWYREHRENKQLFEALCEARRTARFRVIQGGRK